MKRVKISCIIIAYFVLVIANVCFGLTVEELKQMVDRNEEVTIIDVRNSIAYNASHIPGAINIPAHLCSVKRLPPIGQVVVYGDDLTIGLTQQAVNSLNDKEGIFVQILEGGFSRWEALNYPTTGQKGLVEDSVQYITYEQLKTAIQNQEAVLVDIRAQKRSKKSARNNIPDKKDDSSKFADLTEEFPNIRIIQSPINDKSISNRTDTKRFKGGKKGKDGKHTDFYILIDNADGSAEDMAKRMRVSGIKRIFILAGGEETLKRKGKSEIKRTIK